MARKMRRRSSIANVVSGFGVRQHISNPHTSFNRVAITRKLPLSYFRVLTEPRIPGVFHVKRLLNTKTARVSSIMGARLVKSVENTPIQSAICAKRKLRRRVLFALNKQGGNHKKPSYKLESLVRC